MAGKAALYKGDYPLLRNLPPPGGEWHLYHLLDDPGETNDLRERLPERFKSMPLNY